MRHTILKTVAAVAAFAAPLAAHAEVRITEFLYQSVDGTRNEYLELTNLGSSAVDVSNWTYNDNNPNNPVSFGGFFNTLAASESVILTEATAEAFRTHWGLAAATRIFSIGGNSNLGDGDTINIYSSAAPSSSTLVDSVTYATAVPGVSRNRPVGVQGTATNEQFVESRAGDTYGSVFAPTGPADLGNPGRFAVVVAAVPEPATWAMMVGGFGLVGGAMRRRRVRVAIAA